MNCNFMFVVFTVTVQLMACTVGRRSHYLHILFNDKKRNPIAQNSCECGQGPFRENPSFPVGLLSTNENSQR